jgi:hypothetical protein
MQTFTDAAGRTWSLAVNVDAIKRVKALAGVNLLDVVEGKLIERLVTDPVLLCDVLYALAKPEADAKGVTDEEFGRSMAGDAIDLATQALLEELVSFFPKGRRDLLRKALAKLRTFEAMAIQAADRKLDDPALDERLRQLLETPSGSSGSSPESSAAPPAP